MLLVCFENFKSCFRALSGIWARWFLHWTLMPACLNSRGVIVVRRTQKCHILHPLECPTRRTKLGKDFYAPCSSIS